MDYMNPLSVYNPSTYTDPVLQAQTENQKAALAAPFIQQTQQMGQVDLQKALQELQESQSPLAVQARQSALQSTIAKNKVTTDTADSTIADTNAKNNADVELTPHITEQKKQEAILAAQKAKGTPYEDLFNDLSGVADQIEKLPPAQQGMAYQSMIEQWKQTHPDVQVPPSLEVWQGDKTADHLKLIRYAQVNSAKQEQEMAKTTRENQGKTDVANINASAGLAEARTRVAGEAANKPLNPAQARVKYTRVMNDPNASDDDKAEASGNLQDLASDAVNKAVAADPISQMAGLKGDTATVDARRQQIEQQVLQGWGINKSSTASQKPSGGDTVVVVKAGKRYSLPKSQLNQALQSGYQLSK